MNHPRRAFALLAIGVLAGEMLLAGAARAQGNAGADDATRRRRAAAAAEQGTFEVRPGRAPDLLAAYGDLVESARPLFVSTDLALHGTHRVLDAAMAAIEEEAILPALEEAVGALLDAAVFDAQNLDGPRRRSAAAWNAGYLAVARALLSGGALDEARLAKLEGGAVLAAAKEELALVLAHEGVHLSPLFGASPLRSLAGPNGEDYSGYLPRGHYARSERLERYFRGRLYLGRMAFAFPLPGEEPTAIDLRLIQQSLHLASILATRDGIREPWGEVARYDDFFGGGGDDLGPEDITGLWARFRTLREKSTRVETEKGTDDDRLVEFVAYVRDQAASGLVVLPQIREGYVEGMRLLPLAAPWDLVVFERLTRPDDRPLPKGLDVMALLGSAEARERLEQEGDFGLTWYRAEFDAIKEGPPIGNTPRRGSQLPSDRVRNANALPATWLRTIASLLEAAPAWAPEFLRDPEWRLKDLATASASWAELRHDTILYAKQPISARVGVEYDFGSNAAPPPVYLEPRPQFYEHLTSMARVLDQTVTGGRQSLSNVSGATAALVQVLEPLAVISRAELNGENLNASDQDHLRGLAARFRDLERRLLASSKPGEGPIIADVFADHSSGTPHYLLVGTGAPLEIAVVVHPGEPAFEGAIASYYEFVSLERLTDEAWRSRAIHGSFPPLPEWESEWLARLR